MSKSQFGNKFTNKCAISQQGLTTSEQSWQAKQGSISQSMLSGDSSKYMKSMRKVAANKDNFTFKKIKDKKMWQPIIFQETGCLGEMNSTLISKSLGKLTPKLSASVNISSPNPVHFLEISPIWKLKNRLRSASMFILLQSPWLRLHRLPCKDWIGPHSNSPRCRWGPQS